MYRSSTNGAPAHKAAWREMLLLVSLPLAVSVAHAQTGAAAGDGAPSEAARRAATSPYRFILQHANAPAPARKPAAEKDRERDRPKDNDKVETVRRLAPPTEAPVQAAARTAAPAAASAVPVAPSPEAIPAAAPPPEPVQSAARTQPVEAPAARREIIPVQTDEPRLPAALLRERPSGVVRVQFDVQPDGSTSAVKVVSSSNRALNRATVDAVSGWKFQPVDGVLTVETEIAYKYD